MLNHDLCVGAYGRVSGDQQSKEGTIASQLEAIMQRSRQRRLGMAPELCFVDDGYSGDTLVRPGLERLRDQAAAGAIDRLYILDPDRISRKYAYQVLILEELTRCGVEVVFLRNPPGRGPEENLLLQVQGMIAEYERTKIIEALSPGQAVRRPPRLSQRAQRRPLRLPLRQQARGWRRARYQVVADEARVVRKIFEWVGQERCSIGEVCRRLQRDGIPTRTGKSAWDRSVVWMILKNPAYKGTAAFGKTRWGPSSRNASDRSAAAPSSPGDPSLGSIHPRTIKSSSRSPGW